MYALEAGVGVRDGSIGSDAPPGSALLERCITERARVEGSLDRRSWPIALGPSPAAGPTPQSAMALPIVVAETTAAVLVVSREDAARGYSEVERRIADLLTAQIAIALQNADLHARVAETAVRDPLTGLLNRRFFDEAVETAHANARRSGADLSLIVLDLDRFSAVNNDYGHAVGDAVLKRVASAIRGAVRDGDVVVRYGGEEFVVIAPATDGDGAVLAAERIRAAVAATADRAGRRTVRPADHLGRRRQPRRRDRRARPVPGRRFRPCSPPSGPAATGSPGSDRAARGAHPRRPARR